MSAKPVCRLVGENGNVFNIIGRVCNALKRAKLQEQSDKFAERAMQSESYDEVLQLCMEYVDVV